MPIRSKSSLAAFVLTVALAEPASAQSDLPVVDAQPREIGQCGIATDYRWSGVVLSCACPPGSASGPAVWGTDIYTDDSPICRAAVHRGVIGKNGGRVTVQLLPGQSNYQGSARNGVTTGDYGSWDGSYQFVVLPGRSTEVVSDVAGIDVGPCTNASPWRGQQMRLSCTCPANFPLTGSVWGSGTYTDDSDICKAALHAGMLGRKGGRVAIDILPGLDSYQGTNRNGVSSSDYASWAGSYRFVR